MAHQVLDSATAYGITGGKVLDEATEYSIKQGRCMSDGTVHEIPFSKTQIVRITEYTLMVGVAVDGTTWPFGTGEFQFETDGTMDILITLKADFGTSTYDYRRVELNGVLVSQKQASYQFTTDADLIEIQEVAHEQRGGTFGRAFITTS